jgi:hypothetical protein
MSSEDHEQTRRHMDAVVASIRAEVREILSRNGLLERIVARRAQNAARSQSPTTLSPSDTDHT